LIISILIFCGRSQHTSLASVFQRRENTSVYYYLLSPNIMWGLQSVNVVASEKASAMVPC
jgi:hypothetical protein